MKIRVIIVDDEERGIIALHELINNYCTDVQVVGTAANITDAESLIKEKEPDLVFLDIEIPGTNGFQLLEKFNEINFEVIFVTAYQEYAIKAIKFSALDYLLKPVRISELQSAIEKIKKKHHSQTENNTDKYHFFKTMINETNPFKKIILSTMEGYYPVKIEDIIYCKADDSYTHFYLQAGKHYIVSKQLKDFDDILVPHNFFRIHKSYLININHIEKVTKTDGIGVIMSNHEELPVSFRKKDEFIEKIKSI